jgi:acylphosphatase
MSEKILYKIQVKGRVQGVGFRWQAATEATKMGIKGFVKNLPDGSVYIEAEGTRDQLDAYVEWCKKGPRFGNVESVETETSSLSGHKEFRIEK